MEMKGQSHRAVCDWAPIKIWTPKSQVSFSREYSVHIVTRCGWEKVMLSTIPQGEDDWKPCLDASWTLPYVFLLLADFYLYPFALITLCKHSAFSNSVSYSSKLANVRVVRPPKLQTAGLKWERVVLGILELEADVNMRVGLWRLFLQTLQFG